MSDSLRGFTGYQFFIRPSLCFLCVFFFQKAKLANLLVELNIYFNIILNVEIPYLNNTIE